MASTATKPYGNVDYADPGYQDDGKKRYPLDTAEHVRAAWSYINQADNAAKYSADQLSRIKSRIKAAAKKFGIEISERSASLAEEGDFLRAMPFEMVPHGDGQTLEGYAAVFNTPTHIRDHAGQYEESFTPDAFTRTLREKTPALLFEHGMHPLIGKMPLGVIQEIQPDSKGLYVRARLSDNWLIQPVRDAVRDGAITGMSVHFRTGKGGDRWSQSGGSVRRVVTEAALIELGPTLTPAYNATTASIRSILDRLPIIGSSRQGGESDDDPGALAQAVDQALDDAAEKHAAGQDDEAWQLVTSAQASVDALLEALNVPDSDDADGGRSAGFDPNTHIRTGRSAVDADGGESLDERPGNGQPSPQQLSAMQRDRALRLKGVI